MSSLRVTASILTILFPTNRGLYADFFHPFLIEVAAVMAAACIIFQQNSSLQANV